MLNIYILLVVGNLLQKKIIDYCKYASECGLKIAITTNGLAINQDIIQDLSKVNLSHIIFSVDSHIAKLHNELRRVNGLWEKLTENIIMLKRGQPHVKIVINHVLTNRNIESFMEMLRLKEKIPFDFINPIFVKDNDWLCCTKSQLEMFMQNLPDYRECAKQLGIEFLYDDIERFIPNANHNEINFVCRVSDFCAFIDASNAKVYPCDCSVHRDDEWYAYGNVNDDKLKEIWESDKKRELSQEIRNNLCSCKRSCDMANIYFNRYLKEEI